MFRGSPSETADSLGDYRDEAVSETEQPLDARDVGRRDIGVHADPAHPLRGLVLQQVPLVGALAAQRAAARANGITYNRLIQGLKLAGVEVDRRMLAELAVNDAPAFAALVATAKAALPADVNAPSSAA